MMTPQDSQLLLSLHDGAQDRPLWSGFLDQLRSRTRVQTTSIFLRHDQEGRAVSFFSGVQPPAEQLASFNAQFTRAPLPYHQMREGRVYAQAELIDPAHADHRAFYEQLIQPWGVMESRSMRVAIAGELTIWLGCAGGPGIGWGTISALMASLAPHLKVAFRNFAALERASLRADVSTAAMARRDFGWVTLDARGRMVEASANMDDLLKRAHALRRDRYGRLVPQNPALDKELMALIKSYAETGQGRPKAMQLSRDPQMDMLIRPMKDDGVSTASSQVAIAFISGDLWSHDDRVEQLVDLFGLLPSEARLAWALGRGLSLREAAAELGLTEETARYYSKKIYAKSGARGQAELVRNILTSVLAMG